MKKECPQGCPYKQMRDDFSKEFDLKVDKPTKAKEEVQFIEIKGCKRR